MIFRSRYDPVLYTAALFMLLWADRDSRGFFQDGSSQLPALRGQTGDKRLSRKTKKGRTRFLPLIGISVWAAVLTGCAASSDSSDYNEHSPREIMTEAPREGMTDTSHEFMTDTSREFMADASREEAVRHADTATRSETEPAAEALFPEETAAGRTLKTSERRTEEISEGGTEDTTAQTDMRPVTSPDASSSAGDSQSLLTLLREQAERQERRQAYLKAFRSQFRQQLDNTVVEYPDGTRESLKDAGSRKK